MTESTAMISRLVLSVLIITLAGCSQPSTTLPYTVDINEQGVGRIHHDTPFDHIQINTLLPGFDINTYTTFSEGESEPVLRVTRHSAQVMLIFPTKDKEHIDHIIATHPEITLNEKRCIGEPLKKYESMFKSCQQHDTIVLCESTMSPQIHFVTDASRKRVLGLRWNANAGN